jgi:hypothetical protein
MRFTTSTASFCCNGLHCGSDMLSGIVYRKCASEAAGCTGVCSLITFDKIVEFKYSSK